MTADGPAWFWVEETKAKEVREPWLLVEEKGRCEWQDHHTMTWYHGGWEGRCARMTSQVYGGSSFWSWP